MRLVQAVLELALRRWPAHLREEMRAEWHAELHELAAAGRRGQMLRFAVSLAARSPRLGVRQPFLEPDVTAGAMLRQAAFLVVAPAVCVAFSFVIPAIALVLAALLGFVACFAGWACPLPRPWTVVSAVLPPAVAVLLVSPLLLPSLSAAWRLPAATLLWASILAATMLVASRLSPRKAVVAGSAGALAACWSAVTLVIAPRAATLGLDSTFAPMWYPASILSPLDLPLGALPADPNLCVTGDDPCTRYQPASFPLLDFGEGYPTALTLISVCALAYVLAATWHEAGEAVPA